MGKWGRGSKGVVIVLGEYVVEVEDPINIHFNYTG